MTGPDCALPFQYDDDPYDECAGCCFSLGRLRNGEAVCGRRTVPLVPVRTVIQSCDRTIRFGLVYDEDLAGFNPHGVIVIRKIITGQFTVLKIVVGMFQAPELTE